MKQILRIYKRDLNKILSNWVAAGMILGLICLPSLYAWFNIKASWDPYGQTSGLAIAVANNDHGATLRDQPLNLGNEIVTSLKENHNIGWVFTDEKDALAGVKHGDYYASIIIPEDFSDNIATVLTQNPQKAEILYYVNEKINAIAPKITSQGASTIIDEVSRNFIKVANGTIFQIFNQLGIELQSELPTIQKIRDLVLRVETLFPEINQAVSTAQQDIAKSDQIVQKAQTDLPIVAQLAKDGQDFTNRFGEFVDKSSVALDDLAPNIKQDLVLLQQSASATEQLTGLLQDEKVDPAVVKTALDQAARRLTTAVDVTDRMAAMFQRLDSLTGGNHLTTLAGKLQQLKTNLQHQITLVNQIKTAIDKGEKPAAQLVDNLNRLSKEASNILTDLLQRYDSEIVPQIKQGIDKAKVSAQNASKVLTDANQALPDIQRILSDVSKGLSFGGQEIAEVQKTLPGTEAKIKSLADQIRAFEKEANLDEIIELLKLNAQKEAGFFSEPVILKENKLFPIPNYGSGMSPFFTTLSLWVGALLLVSVLTVDVHHPKEEFRSYQIYFGRYLTFGTLGLFQSLLATLGDIFILKTYVVDKLWFVLFGMLLSAVFVLIVYTLVSVFGNVGKAMAIVLLVLQLAGSGGTFPIQMTLPFFQAIHPYLPFTYGISMMREAVGGILWDIVWRDFLMMAVYVTVTLIIGLALKGWINRSSAKLVRKAKESELIH